MGGKQMVRKGDDMVSHITIDLREALLGWKVELRHLDGHVVKLQASDPTMHGQVFRIKGEGMPKTHDPGSFGDLHVVVNVSFPEQLTSTDKKHLGEVFSKMDFFKGRRYEL